MIIYRIVGVMGVDARGKILQAATEMIITQSYHGTGTNAIIAQTGISKGSFFYRLPIQNSCIKKVR